MSAAAFALGLSLAGPHGTATADGTTDATGSDSAAVTAATDSTQAKAGPVRARRGAPSRSARTTAAPAATAAAKEPAKAAGAARRRALPNRAVSPRPSAATAPTARPAATASSAPVRPAPSATSPAVAVPAAAVSVAVSDLPAPASASAAGTCSGCRPFAAKTRAIASGRSVTATVRAAELLDGLGHWLSGLPSRQGTAFLAGALQLVRRNLFADVPIVHVGNVTVSESGNQAIFTVTLDKPFTSALTVGYKTAGTRAQPGEAGDLSTRAGAGSDYEETSGVLTFVPGQTSQLVVVNCLDDYTAEAPESFTLDILRVINPQTLPAGAKAAASGPSAARVAAASPDVLSQLVIASATAIIVDDECIRIDVNPNFAYGDALLAASFSDLAYNHRVEADFNSLVQSTGWEGIGVTTANLGAKGYSPAAGGYGVKDGVTMQSFAFAGKRTATDGTEQFIISFEGSNSPLSEPADWIANAGEYGWSRYYASLEPLVTEVVGQMLQAQSEQKNTQLIITGHSLGGAAAEMAFADLLTPQGNLWPDTAAYLSAGNRVLDTVGGWSDATRTALLAATSVYTFGAPSILIEPTKPGMTEAAAFAAVAASAGLVPALGLLPAAIATLVVDEKKVPSFTGIAGINFATRVFQLEHANTSWRYPGDIVAQIGSRDPGTVLNINIDNSIHQAYTSWLLRYVPGGTHSMTLYRESVLRLISNSPLLKNPNELAASTPQLTPTAAGQGSDGRNDYFVNLSDSGKAGNDVFAYSRAGSYSADGGDGTDTYSVNSYNVALTIDGSMQSGRDSLVFNIAGTPGAQYSNSGSGPRNDTAVFSVTGADGKSSSVTVTHWDQWQINDVFQVISPADGQWSLNHWTIENGPVVVEPTPVDEVPLSVV
ncbi:MAG: Calx-beta domain-containing protein [Mycobacterium sp.]